MTDDVIPSACYSSIIKSLPSTHGSALENISLTRDYLDSLNIGSIYGSSLNPIIVLSVPSNIVAQYQCGEKDVLSNANMVLNIEHLNNICFYMNCKRIGLLKKAWMAKDSTFLSYKEHTWEYVAIPVNCEYYTETYSCTFSLRVLTNIVHIQLQTCTVEYHKALIIKNTLTTVLTLTPEQKIQAFQRVKRIIEYCGDDIIHPLHLTLLECLCCYPLDKNLQEHLLYMFYYKGLCPYNISRGTYGFTANDIYGHLVHLENLYDISVRLSASMVLRGCLELLDFLDNGFYIYDPGHISEIIRGEHWDNLEPILTYAGHHHLIVDYKQILKDLILYDRLQSIPAGVFTYILKHYCHGDKRIWGTVSMIITKLNRHDLVDEMRKHRGSPLKKSICAKPNSEHGPTKPNSEHGPTKPNSEHGPTKPNSERTDTTFG